MSYCARYVIIAGLFTTLFLAGCGFSDDQQPQANMSSATATKTPITLPPLIPTSTRVLVPSPTATASPMPTNTPLPSPSLTPSPTPTLKPSDTFAGDPLPTNLSVITEDNLADLELLARWGKGTVESVVHSPDGSLIAVASSRGAYLYDALSLEEVLLLPTHEWAYDVAFSPDGKLLAIQTACRTELYNIENRNILWRGNFEECWLDGSVAFSPDGQYVASGLYSDVNVRKASDGGLLHQMQTTKRWDSRYFANEPTSVLDLQFSPDGSILAVGQSAPAINLFKVSSGENFANLEDLGVGANLYDGEDAEAITFTPDGSFLVAINYFPGSLDFFEVSSMEFSHSLDSDHMEHVISLAISPTGDRIALGKDHWNGERQYVVQIHDLEDGNHLQTLEGPDGPITTLSFSTDGERIIAGAIDNTLHLWRVLDGALLGDVQDHTDMIYDLDFSPDSHLLAVAMKDRKARLWRLPDGALLYKLGATSAFGYSYESFVPGMYSLDFSSDGGILATGSDRYEGARLWDVSTGSLIRNIPSFHVFQLDFASDEALVIESGWVGRTFSWGFDLFDLRVGENIKAPLNSGHETELAVSTNGDLLAASFIDYDSETHTCWTDIWSISEAEFSDPWKLLDVEDCPGSMVFSPNSAYLVLAYEGNDDEGKLSSVKLINVVDGSTRSEFVFRDVELGQPLGMDFSPGGELLAVIRSQGLIQLFRIPDMVRVSSHYIQTSTSPLLENLYFYRSGKLRFSPDGKLLALALADGSIQLWGVLD